MATVVHQPRPRLADIRSVVRSAGWASLVVTALLLITPITVFGLSAALGLDAAAAAAGYSPADYGRDPVLASGWEGAIYGIQMTAVGIALGFAGLRTAPVVGRDALSRAGVAGVLSAAVISVVSAGMSATLYGASMTLAGIDQIQPDGDVRRMIGYAALVVTQGLMGAFGLGITVWLLSLASAGSRIGLTRTPFLVVAGGFGALIVAGLVMGVGGLTSLLVIFPLTAFGIGLLAAARRTAGSTISA
ncbi:MAG: hypothetical protein VB080_14560 [Propionicimonas sp.]|uniref:hypothetical protein n=1 Tax=Propionicimonas sp. TaxID=1955623 RepID=UPI002B1EC0A8|nr:hypothetical protein [Propionicimonas sp.]MEA4945642.1 hypothetical protein [Propionicimonas sp.]